MTRGGNEFPRSPAPLAVVAGVRTPFAKAFGARANVPADQLGRVAVEAVLARAGDNDQWHYRHERITARLRAACEFDPREVVRARIDGRGLFTDGERQDL